MKKCQKCGQNLYNEAVLCPRCGCAQDAPSFGFAVLGFLWPLAGLILWLALKNITPLKARSAGRGALLSILIPIVFFVVLTVLFIVLFAVAAA